MSTFALSHKAANLMKLCDLEGFDDLLQAVATDSVCPAICMTDGCDYASPPPPHNLICGAQCPVFNDHENEQGYNESA
jgi:hypothetical protein